MFALISGYTGNILNFKENACSFDALLQVGLFLGVLTSKLFFHGIYAKSFLWNLNWTTDFSNIFPIKLPQK